MEAYTRNGDGVPNPSSGNALVVRLNFAYLALLEGKIA